jgi:SnoaL-like domain
MNLADDAEIQKIAIYYARGVDTLGNEKDVAKALEYLRRGFTDDCVFNYFWPDGSIFGNINGLQAFVDFAFGFMKEKQYRNTQHLVSNFLTQDAGVGCARMESDVVARHIKADNSQDIAVAHYDDEIVKRDGQWKCRSRKCVQLSFDNYAPAYSLT